MDGIQSLTELLKGPAADFGAAHGIVEMDEPGAFTAYLSVYADGQVPAHVALKRLELWAKETGRGDLLTQIKTVKKESELEKSRRE